MLLRILLFICSLSWVLCACDDSSTANSEDNMLEGMAGTTAGNDTTGTMTNTQLDQTSNTSFQVLAPTTGQIFNTPTITINGTHPTASSVLVQGMEIAVQGQQFNTTLTLTEGVHTIIVSDIEQVNQTRLDIMIDLTPPKINIIDPSYGNHIDANMTPSITLVAQAHDSLSGIASAKVNQINAIIDERGSFQFPYSPVPGINRLQVEVSDQAGNISTRTRSFLYGRFRSWELPLERSAFAWITPFAFNTLEIALKNAVDNGLINDLIASAGNAEGVQITEVSYRGFDVNVTPQEGYLDLQIRFDLLRIFFYVEQYDTTGYVAIDPAILNTKLYITPTIDGQVNVELRDTVVDLVNFQIDVDNLLGAFLTVVESFVADFTEDALIQVVENLLIDELVDERLFKPTLSLFDRILQLQIITQTVNFSSIESSIVAGLAVISDQVFNYAPGYLYQENTGEVTSLPNMLSVGLQLNLLNMLTAHFWRAGFMNITLAELVDEPPAPLKASLMSGFTKDQALLEYMNPEESVGVSLRPQLPPVVKFNAARTDIVVLQVDDVLLDLTLPDGRPWITLHLNLYVTLSPKIVNSDLELDLSLQVQAWEESTPIFEVDSKRLLDVLVPLIENIPELIGTEGVNDIINLSQANLFGLQLDSVQVQTSTSPYQMLKIGFQLEAL